MATDEKQRKQMDELQETCRTIINAFKNEQTDITRPLQHYKYVLSNYQNNSDIYNNDQRDYIFNHFIENSVRALMEREHTHFQSDWNAADEITYCCKLLISIAIPLIKQDSDVAKVIINHCLHPRTPFFRVFGNDWRQRRGNELSKHEIKELQQWRNTDIKEEARVDYLLANRWRYGRIHNIKLKHISNDEVIVLDIHPLMEGMYPQYIARNNDTIYTEEFVLSPQTYGQIAKPLTKSIEQRPHMVEWRKNLTNKTDEKVSKCDVLDAVHKWYTCTILEDDPGANRFKINYDGWSGRYDEWIYRDKKNLQPHLSHATGGRETKGVTGDLEELEPYLEDEEDPDDDDVYVMWRGRLNDISFHLIDILNEFGKCGGFDAVLDRLRNKEPIIPIVLLRYILSPLAHVYKCYTRQFAKTFIKPLIDLIVDILESLGENELAHLRKDYLERIIYSVGGLMRRHCMAEVVYENIDKLHLLMALKRLRCLNIDRKVDAAQYVSDVCSRIGGSGYNAQQQWIKPSYLAKWIHENGVLYCLFGPSNEMLEQNGILIGGYIRINFEGKYLPFDVMKLIGLWYNEQSHTSIMKQSVNVLKFISACSADMEYADMEFDHVSVLWNIIQLMTDKNDDELSSICNIAVDILHYLDVENVECLVSKIQEMDVSLIKRDHVLVISAVIKVFKEEEIGDKCLMFLWDIIQDNAKCEKSVVEFAMNTLASDSVVQTDADFRERLCIANLKEHRSVCVALKFLCVLLKGMNETERYIMIEHLIDNEKLLKLYLDDIIHFKKYIKQQMTEKVMSYKDKNNANEYIVDSEINDLKVFTGQRTYLDEVKERVKFLNFLSKHYDLKLKEEDKSIVYSHFIENAETNEERIIAIIKLKYIIKNDDCNDKDKYPLFDQEINEEYSDEEEDEAQKEEMFPVNDTIATSGIDPTVLAALGYTDDQDMEQQLLFQSLMAHQAELYQSFQQQ